MICAKNLKLQKGACKNMFKTLKDYIRKSNTNIFFGIIMILLSGTKVAYCEGVVPASDIEVKFTNDGADMPTLISIVQKSTGKVLASESHQGHFSSVGESMTKKAYQLGVQMGLASCPGNNASVEQNGKWTWIHVIEPSSNSPLKQPVKTH